MFRLLTAWLIIGREHLEQFRTDRTAPFNMHRNE